MRNVGEISNFLDKLSYSYVCIVVMSQVFHQKLKIKTTKVSKEDFLLVDMGLVPNP
jgi:hypothetical protein